MNSPKRTLHQLHHNRIEWLRFGLDDLNNCGSLSNADKTNNGNWDSECASDVLWVNIMHIRTYTKARTKCRYTDSEWFRCVRLCTYDMRMHSYRRLQIHADTDTCTSYMATTLWQKCFPLVVSIAFPVDSCNDIVWCVGPGSLVDAFQEFWFKWKFGPPRRPIKRS